MAQSKMGEGDFLLPLVCARNHAQPTTGLRRFDVAAKLDRLAHSLCQSLDSSSLPVTAPRQVCEVRTNRAEVRYPEPFRIVGISLDRFDHVQLWKHPLSIKRHDPVVDMALEATGGRQMLLEPLLWIVRFAHVSQLATTWIKETIDTTHGRAESPVAAPQCLVEHRRSRSGRSPDLLLRVIPAAPVA